MVSCGQWPKMSTCILTIIADTSPYFLSNAANHMEIWCKSVNLLCGRGFHYRQASGFVPDVGAWCVTCWGEAVPVTPLQTLNCRLPAFLPGFHAPSETSVIKLVESEISGQGSNSTPMGFAGLTNSFRPMQNFPHCLSHCLGVTYVQPRTTSSAKLC